MSQTTVVHHQHYQVHALRADLQAPASAADADKGGRAPSRARAGTSAAHRHSAPVLGTEDEAGFDQMRNHHDAFGIFQYFFRNTLIGGGSDFLENVGRILQS